MNKQEFEELSIINKALGGKYDAVVQQLGKELTFGVEQKEELIGPRDKVSELVNVIIAIKEFRKSLIDKELGQFKNRSLSAKFLTTKKIDPLITTHKLTALKDFFEKGGDDNLGHDIFKELFWKQIQSYLDNLSGELKFKDLWNKMITVANTTFNTAIQSLGKIGAAKTIQSIKDIEKPVIPYFIANYPKLKKVGISTSPNIDQLCNILS
ncbi:MAG: hypothetical protein GY810_09945 [Aureispira sp.]|nr:hypothetical protein [Aureispira sp.]